MRARSLRLGLGLIAVVSLGAGCGEDDPPPIKPRDNKAPVKPKTASGAKPAGAVVAYRRIEDRVASDAEKKAIRHKFSERDYAPDITGTENRDPFRSFVVAQPGIGSGSGPPIEATDACPRKRQWARAFSARELKLVGIVARGTIRYALFSDPGQYGYVIHPGDCIGKEKARVKEIGASFVTLEISSEAAPNQPARPAVQHSIQLHPKDLPIGETDDEAPDQRGTPSDLRQRSDDLLRGERTTAPLPPAPDQVEPVPPSRQSPPTQQ